MIVDRDGLSDADLDALLAMAYSEGRAGQIDDAIASLLLVIAELDAKGERHAFLYEWQAHLHRAVGDLAIAERCLASARDIAV